MSFLRLITKMGLYDTLWPLIIPSIASPAVTYFMYSYLQSNLPLSLVGRPGLTAAESSVPSTASSCPSCSPPSRFRPSLPS